MRKLTIGGLLLVLVALSFTSVSSQSAVQAPYVGMWLTAAELENLPTTGAAWNNVLSAADGSAGSPNISDQDNQNDVIVLAKALVYARTGSAKYRTEVIQNLKLAVGTESGGRTLALGRNLVSYVIAADLVNLPVSDPEFHGAFSTWLSAVRTKTLDGRTLISTHEDRPNNWGTHAGASRVAADLYLNDEEDLARAAVVFAGYLGDRSQYADFAYGTLGWQCNPSAPVGVNPMGCRIQNIDVGGSLPEEMRRGGSFSSPPLETGYAWEALQGVLVQATLLERAGYDTFEWSNQAILRAVQYLYRIDWQPEGDDVASVPLINFAYGAQYGEAIPARPAKNFGWTDWTHSGRRIDVQIPLTPMPVVTVTATPTPTQIPTMEPTGIATATEVVEPTVEPTATLVCLQVILTDPPTVTYCNP